MERLRSRFAVDLEQPLLSTIASLQGCRRDREVRSEDRSSITRDTASHCAEPCFLGGYAASMFSAERCRQQSQRCGAMIVHQPEILAPIFMNFPLPAWPTHGEEVDDQDLDKQAREFARKF